MARLFDEFIGTGKQRGWHFQAERLRSLEVDHQLVLGRRLHRQVGRPLTFENAIDVRGGASVRVNRISPIGNQAAAGDMVAERVDRRQAVLSSERYDLVAMN